MKRSSWSLLSILVLLVGCSGCAPRRDQEKEPNPEFQKWLDLVEQGSRRQVNGARLRVHSKVEDGIIKINWTLEYYGPRPPLTILKPVFPRGCNGGATFVRVFAEGQPPNIPLVRLNQQDCPAGPWFADIDSFITIEKDKKVSGEIDLLVTTVKAKLIKEWPELFDGPAPPVLYLQFHHQPRDRGEDHGLDAWTGNLDSQVMKLKIAKW